MGGPADCLQYYTATSGTVARYFFFYIKKRMFFNSNFHCSQLQLSYQPKCNRFNKWVTICILNSLFMYIVFFCNKVHIFWEGHNVLQNLHRRFVLCSDSQIYGGDFAKFCGLLRIYELYEPCKIPEIYTDISRLLIHLMIIKKGGCTYWCTP